MKKKEIEANSRFQGPGFQGHAGNPVCALNGVWCSQILKTKRKGMQEWYKDLLFITNIYWFAIFWDSTFQKLSTQPFFWDSTFQKLSTQPFFKTFYYNKNTSRNKCVSFGLILHFKTCLQSIACKNILVYHDCINCLNLHTNC